MRFTTQEIADLIAAIDSAQAELALGFPEADAIAERWQRLRAKLSQPPRTEPEPTCAFCEQTEPNCTCEQFVKEG